MNRLNESRRLLKHHGNLPQRLTIEDFRASVTSFFEDNCPRAFDMAFQDVSLVGLIGHAGVKGHLTQAELRIREATLDEALDETAKAFAWLLDDYEDSLRSGTQRTSVLSEVTSTGPSAYAGGLDLSAKGTCSKPALFPT